MIKHSFSDIDPFFSAADNYCREKLGYLVEYENRAQEELLHNYLRPIYAEDTTFWIGLRDFHTEDTFIWEHSKKTTNVSHSFNFCQIQVLIPLLKPPSPKTRDVY